MPYKKVKTKKDIENDLRVDSIHREFGFAGDNKWGWWCYLKEGWKCSNKSSTINEQILNDVCYEINNCLTKR